MIGTLFAKLQTLDWWVIFIILFVTFLVIHNTLVWVRDKRIRKKLIIGEGKGIQYYPNRKALGADIDAELENTDRAFVLWYTGYGARGYNIHRRGIIEKMILVDPKYCYKEPLLSHIRNISRRTPEEVAQDIKTFAKESHKAEIEVRWLSILPQELLVISNPKAANAWIRIEPFDLTKNAGYWHSIRIYKKEQPDLFKALADKYVYLWADSKEPDWDKL